MGCGSRMITISPCFGAWSRAGISTDSDTFSRRWSSVPERGGAPLHPVTKGFSEGPGTALAGGTVQAMRKIAIRPAVPRWPSLMTASHTGTGDRGSKPLCGGASAERTTDGHTTVDRELLAGDVRRLVAGQVQGGARHLCLRFDADVDGVQPPGPAEAYGVLARLAAPARKVGA